MTQLPECLKEFDRHLSRAQEIDKSNPLVAYFTRVFVMEKTIPKLKSFSGQDKSDATAFVADLMNQLESV